MMGASFNGNMTAATSGAGTVCSSGAPGLSPVFIGGSCCSIFCCLCIAFLFTIICLFVLIRLDIVLFVLLRITSSDCPFGIFKFFS